MVENAAAGNQVIVYATAEAPQRRKLAELCGYKVVSGARETAELIESSEAEQIVFVPASTGRDLTAVTQLAQTLTWLKSKKVVPELVLSAPMFNDTYTIAYLRKQIRQAADRGNDAILFVAQAVDPFANAELFRRVRLAEQYSEKIQVSLCFDATLPTKADVFPTAETALGRLKKLGAESIALVRADLGLWVDDVQKFDLCGSRGMRTAIQLSAHNAQHAASHGDDGLAAGLLADHAAGFAHSHGDEDEHSHSHGHTHVHGHAHSHPHTHSHTH
ncbi:hypothetical protein [Corynebacterium suicordis]|uniref:Cobalamin biosynthesis protein CbiX n=1 Tax=Corynebacterium suicordis DSM 45110 TaxID=1121369 RepID=A0ABR9ZH65_9CORY|nr:hypothetical protein [Corynebacterium suicordis]MBF4552755.1 hypothetical protein [Corynebacterium suicordis DSM 45110]MDR6278286.1 hypothetical protein [Corynebacterium suicordis]